MYEINMIKNIRELLKDTIFAHPEDVKEMIDASKMMTKEKPKKKK